MRTAAACDTWTRRGAGAGAMNAYWIGLALLGVLAVCGASFLLGKRGLSPRMRERLAAREDANGRSLLRLADEIESHAPQFERAGLPAHKTRAWAGLCRRIATEHLACINALLAEPEVGRELIGFGRERESGRDD